MQPTASSLSFTPTLRASLPADWLAKESITLLAPDGQANVIASSEPLAPDVDLHRYAGAQGELLRTEFPGFVENTFEEMTVFRDRAGYLRRFEWSPPEGERVTQLQLYYVEDARGYTATATSPTATFREYEPDLLEILLSLTIVPRAAQDRS